MKKIFLAVAILFAAATGAMAKSQYSPEPPSLLDQILGTSSSEWHTVPQMNIRYRLRNGGNFVHAHGQHYQNAIHNTHSPAQIIGSVYRSIVAYGHMLQNMGYRVSEHPAFGGVHHVHHGWAHYAGRAIDINIGTGNKEASNGSMSSRFDALAARARAAGYTVLWKVAGHFDHIHIQK
jgi:D-alanyl-D-alanine dipeptidase